MAPLRDEAARLFFAHFLRARAARDVNGQAFLEPRRRAGAPFKKSQALFHVQMRQLMRQHSGQTPCGVLRLGRHEDTLIEHECPFAPAGRAVRLEAIDAGAHINFYRCGKGPVLPFLNALRRGGQGVNDVSGHGFGAGLVIHPSISTGLKRDRGLVHGSGGGQGRTSPVSAAQQHQTCFMKALYFHGAYSPKR